MAILYDKEVCDYLETFDFIICVETFVKNIPPALLNFYPNHVEYFSPAIAIRDATTARLSGGVLVLVKKYLKNHVFKLHVEYDNTVVLKLDGQLFDSNMPVLLTATYLPPTGSPYYAEMDVNNGVSFLEQCLLDIVEEFPGCPLIVGGDLNSRTGDDNGREIEPGVSIYDVFDEEDMVNNVKKRASKDIVTNDFGRYLLTVCGEFDLSILNGMIMDESSGNFTYVAPNGCSVVDYFIVSNVLLTLSFRMSVGQRIERKHQPIELYMSGLQKSNNNDTNTCTGIYKMDKIKWDPGREGDFKTALVSPAVKLLLDEACMLIDVNVNRAITKFQEILHMAGSCMKKTLTCGIKRKQPWFDAECHAKRKEVRQHLRKFNDSNTQNDRVVYNIKRNEYTELIRVKRINHRQSILDTLNNENASPSEFWGKIRESTSKRVVSNNISTQKWFTHFQKLFNDIEEADDDQLDIHEEFNVKDIDSLEADITNDEVIAAIRSLKNSKAAGPDGIISEFFKHSDTSLLPFLAKLFNKLYVSGTYPEAWSESIIQPIHKKGDVNSPDNYRGISLLNIISKIYSRILNKRLVKWLEDTKTIHECQAGFRKNYSTIDHVFTLSAMVHKQLSYHRKMYVAFIDFRKAFDSVVHSKLWQVLRKNGIHGRMYNAIVSMYEVVKAKVRANGEVTDSFDCPRGVKQGEVLSPALFSLLINELANEIVRYGRHGVQILPDILQIFILMFADDIILMSDSVCGLQNQLNVLHDTAKDIGLGLNLDKSKVIVFRNGGHIASHEKWLYGGEQMDIVNVYKYLGIFMSTRLSFSHSISDMAARARAGTVSILRLLWSLGERSPRIFFKLFDAQIQPMLNYGAEVWGLTVDLSILERVHLFALKRFLNVSVRTPNSLVYGETGRFPLFVNIYVKCVKYWLRLLKMEPNRYPRKAYNMLLYMHEHNRNTWASSICFMLYRYGFDEAWQNQGVGNEKAFVKLFRERVILVYKHEWSTDLESKDRFTLYSSFKSELTLSPYLTNLKHVKSRNALIRLRLGVSQLNTHRFRFARGNFHDFGCPFCKDQIESEIHFVLVCPAYDELRSYYLPHNFFRNPCLHKLSVLLATENRMILMRLAKFLSEAFAKRELMYI